MTDTAARILVILERYISPINARVIFQRATKSAGVEPKSLSAEHVSAVIGGIERSMQIFVSAAQKRLLLADLEALVMPSTPAAVVVAITDEKDLSKARLMARGMCTELRVAPYALQKIATAVSELARNIVKYALPGSIELSVADAPRRLLVVATDQGPGITNLDEVLAGHHHSTTGMGLGLLGTKKMADRFDIATSRSGTRVTAEFVL